MHHIMGGGGGMLYSFFYIDWMLFEFLIKY